jgi:hypothetical protein
VGGSIWFDCESAATLTIRKILPPEANVLATQPDAALPVTRVAVSAVLGTCLAGELSATRTFESASIVPALTRRTNRQCGPAFPRARQGELK